VGLTVTRPRPAGIVRHERATRPGIPEATVSRLPLYLQALTSLAEQGLATVSSEELAAAAGVGSAKLRKDLSHLGSYGTRGVGYEVEYLVYQISRELGLTQDWRVIIVGVGNLGHALANYNGFTSRGFTVAALVDAAPEVAGTSVAGLPVLPLGELDGAVRELEIQIGVVATPADVAQDVVDRLVSAGITGVLNFAPCVLSVPDGVMVRRVDLATELQILAFHEQRRAAGELAADGDALAEVALTSANGSKGISVHGFNGKNGYVKAALARDIVNELTNPPARTARRAGAAG
jgi:redox-sensing transcriptional repressor